MKKIKKGDDVIVIAGKDRGKHASVTKLVGQDRVLVQGINKVKKHQKPNPGNNIPGGIIEIEKPLHISNIAIYNFHTKKADKIGFNINSDNTRSRIYKSSGELIDS